jgi:LysM repeat protein
VILTLGALGAASACYKEAPALDVAPPTTSTGILPTSVAVQAATPEVEGLDVEAGDGKLSAAASASPSPAFAGTYSGTPTPDPTPLGHEPGSGSELVTVGRGQTLGWIALKYGCDVEEIVALNRLADANSIYAGQQLLIPVTPTRTSPAHKLIPDSEMVYGPAYIHFDLDAFVSQQGGYLASYYENVEGVTLTGPEIIRLVSQRTSVGPRILLALLEFRSGWVTQATPTGGTYDFPLGYYQGYGGLFRQLEWAAVRLNEGYYGWKWGHGTTMRLADGTRVAIAPGLNAGTAGIQNCLAYLSDTWDEWVWASGVDGFQATYERLFGSSFAYAIEPLVPDDLVMPDLQLPWESGTTWYLVGGPHGAWGEGGDRSAIDFAPTEVHIGCAPSAQWATAAAPGLVVRSDGGEVLLDLDGDGFEQSGWVLFYMHVHGQDRVEAGTYLEQGDRIGHPSCEGGYAEATHLHLARRYNGEWIPAGADRLPMTLSGWTAHAGKVPYEGTMTRGDEVRADCECWEDEYNGLLADGGQASSSSPD